ncbi:MAG: transglycosylase SLT domain-containing protein [Rhodospirillaceae bacterium]
MGTSLVGAHSSWPPPVDAARGTKRVLWRYLIIAVIGLSLATAVAADRWLRVTTLQSRPVAPQPSALFQEPLVVSITVSAGYLRAPWVTTDKELRESTEMWKRMHFADWNVVPEPLRAEGLDRMLRHYRGLFNNPKAWDTMSVYDWDAVPQPVRTIAYRRMVAYWAGFYHVGAAFGLPAPLVAETLSAIVMSESWFDHRAQAVNRDGTLDVGLAQASPFARERLRELHARGRVDASLAEEDYYNPWRATRFVALWMQLMIEEAKGDLDMAVRAYNRGTAGAGDSLGADYLATVQQRLALYIRNVDAPPSWDYIWRNARELIRTTPVPD